MTMAPEISQHVIGLKLIICDCDMNVGSFLFFFSSLSNYVASYFQQLLCFPLQLTTKMPSN